MFESPVYTTFFGIPLIAMNYTGTVIPVIFVVYFASKCEKLFSKFIPDLVKFFFVPMLTLLVALPVGFVVIGPIATFGSNIIADVVISIRDFSPMVAGAIVGLTWQILVIFGLHWGFIPVYINNIQLNGYDNVMMPFFACTFATSAVVLAIFFKTKNRKLKEMCLPNFISGIFGVTEPAIYGITLPLKKPFIISCIAGMIGGGFYGAFNFRKFSMGGMGIFEFPAMIEPDGGMGNLIVAFVGAILSMVIGFILTMIVYKDKTEPAADGKTGPDTEDQSSTQETSAETGKTSKADGNIASNNGQPAAPLVKKLEIASPLTGKIIQQEDMQDEAFASGVLGKGVAIQPEDGKVYAPADGEISVLFPTFHAIGIQTESGAELLIHIGLNTVQLEGRGFTPKVHQGDKITKGQLIMEFDKDLIEKEGYSTESPVLVSNADDYMDIIAEKADHTEAGGNLLTIIC